MIDHLRTNFLLHFLCTVIMQINIVHIFFEMWISIIEMHQLSAANYWLNRFLAGGSATTGFFFSQSLSFCSP
jgi:hypothetical protein